MGDNIGTDIAGAAIAIAFILSCAFVASVGLLWVTDSIKKKRDGYIGRNNTDDE